MRKHHPNWRRALTRSLIFLLFALFSSPLFAQSPLSVIITGAPADGILARWAQILSYPSTSFVVVTEDKIRVRSVRHDPA